LGGSVLTNFGYGLVTIALADSPGDLRFTLNNLTRTVHVFGTFFNGKWDGKLLQDTKQEEHPVRNEKKVAEFAARFNLEEPKGE
jgi:hypothetical protein